MNKLLHILRDLQQKKWLLWGGCCCVVLIFITDTTSLLISPSKSLPQRVFLLVKGTHAHKGQLAAIQGHPTAYFGDVMYTKQIQGVAGDRIENRKGCIVINGKKLFPLQTHTTKGQPLTPLKAQIIPKGYVFVGGSHPSSFDSRYQEFGLVAQQHILGRVWGIF